MTMRIGALTEMTIRVEQVSQELVTITVVGHSVDRRAPIWHVDLGDVAFSAEYGWAGLGTVLAMIGQDLWTQAPDTAERARFVVDGGLSGYWQDPLF